MDFSTKLIELRKRKGLTQEGLAAKLYVTRQAVSRWETGFTVPSTDNLSHLGRLYGVTLDELLSYSAALPPEKPQEEAPAQQPKAEAPAPTPPPAAASAPAHARAIIIALSILCLLLAIGVGVLLHQKHSENRELTFDEIESESIEDADIDEFQFG